MPQRIQLRRTKGWRMPDDSIKVDRSTRWGNPYQFIKVDDEYVVVNTDGAWLGGMCADVPEVTEMCLRLFRTYAEERIQREPNWLKPLHGKNLACWCRDDQVCHADILLELANNDTLLVSRRDLQKLIDRVN